MAKINRLEDLPEWFDLEKYRGCESFSAEDWYNCLQVRAGALYLVEEVNKLGVSLEDIYKKDNNDNLHEQMRSDPLNWELVRVLHILRYWQLGEKEAGSLVPESPVKPLEFVDLFAQRQGDREDRHAGRENSRAELWSVFDNFRGTGDGWTTLIGSPVGAVAGGFETIKVDLQASDFVLKEAFANWLKEARAQQKYSVSRRERPAYKDWGRYGLLPYLDLLIWAKETGNQIPYNIMAQAVGYIRGGDSFRKTVPQLADSLMRNLNGLAALAAIEQQPE